MKKNNSLMMIAGPCSIDQTNVGDVYDIAQISVTNRNNQIQKAVAGTRVVGLKSRTSLNASDSEMGIDYSTFISNLNILMEGKGVNSMRILPSMEIAADIIKKTGMLVATEVMSPLVQLPLFERCIPKDKLLIWNPSVNQLGWPVLKMGVYAKRNGWYVGLKNGKWYGDEQNGHTSMEKTWVGLAHYADLNATEHAGKLILIHRGVDISGKGKFRNALVHEAAKRVKLATGAKLFFDPSHTYGYKLRDSIPEATCDAMSMLMNEEEYLYDGVLIEVGNSKTDTEQHITVKELEIVCNKIATFRDLIPPTKP